MILYLDASAIVKRYVEEPGTEGVLTLMAEAEAAGTNLISRAEVAAGVMRAARMNVIARDEALRVLRAFHAEWDDYLRLAVTETTVARAGDLVRDHDLRGYDAVHLAAAGLWQEALGEGLVLATFDGKLKEAARALGMRVWPN